MVLQLPLQKNENVKNLLQKRNHLRNFLLILILMIFKRRIYHGKKLNLLNLLNNPRQRSLLIIPKITKKMMLMFWRVHLKFHISEAMKIFSIQILLHLQKQGKEEKLLVWKDTGRIFNTFINKTFMFSLHKENSVF